MNAVGFRDVRQLDPSRSYRESGLDLVTGDVVPGPNQRPVQMLVWYPAEEGGDALTYGDYVAAGAEEDRFDRPSSDEVKVSGESMRWATALGFQGASLNALMHSPVHARRSAPATAGRFPVVVYAASDSSSAAENDMLCEYLAGHGYVVIAVPSIGERRRYMGDGSADAPHADMRDLLADTEAQAADIGFAIGYASGLPDADVENLAVAGFSWGGMAAVFAAARDSRIKAMVNLDGSMRYYPALLAMAPSVRAERLQLPLLFFASEDSPIQPLRDSRPGSLVDRMRYGDVYTVQMFPLEHNDFSADTQRLDPGMTGSRFSIAQVHDAYAWVARYTLAFLDGYLKDSAQGREFLRSPSAANGVAPGILASAWRKAMPGPAVMKDFVSAIRKANWLHVEAVYTRFHLAQPAFHLLEDGLGNWQAALAAEGENEKARAIARLAVRLYPRSASAWAQLGIADEALSQSSAAARDYERAIRIDPNGSSAAKLLARLRLQSPLQSP